MLGILLRKNSPKEALRHYAEALRIHPSGQAHFSKDQSSPAGRQRTRAKDNKSQGVM